MMIAKGLALVSVLWNLAGNSEAPFLDRQPVRAPNGASVSASPTTAPVAQASVQPAPVVADNPAAPDASASVGPGAAPEVAADPAAPEVAAPVVLRKAPVAPVAAASPVAEPSPVVAPSPEVAAAEEEAEPEAAPATATGPRPPLGPQKGPTLTAVHVTGWVMQLPQRLAGLIAASKAGGLTAMIFEVKDVNGELFFKMESSDGTNRFSEAIKACHDANIKVIARYCVFKDKLAEEKLPGTRYGTTAGTNTRHKPWTNPQTKATQDYNIGLIKELVAMGVDEVNLDYIRFPSGPEGVNIDMPLPAKCKAIADFVRRVRAVVPRRVRLSLDVFGYVAWDENSARVGQRLEDLAPHVDGIYPMLYPDHFAKGDLGFKQPVEHPYEVIRRGCEAARAKKGMEHVDVIPWLQAFSLGSDSITYGPIELLAQIQGGKDAGVPSWLAWNPRVNYADLDKALAMTKGKTNYTPWVKKYIPQKYLVASAASAANPAAADADAEEELPAAPTANVGTQTTRPTAAALQLENVDPTAIPTAIPSADSASVPHDGHTPGAAPTAAPAGASAAAPSGAGAAGATAAAPSGAGAAAAGTTAAGTTAAGATAAGATAAGATAAGTTAAGTAVAATSAAGTPAASTSAAAATAPAVLAAESAPPGAPLAAAPYAPPATGGAQAATIASPQPPAAGTVASVTTATAGGASAGAPLAPSIASAPNASVAPLASTAPSAPIAPVTASTGRVTAPELAAVTPPVAPGANVTAPTPVAAESAAVPPPSVEAAAEKPIEAPSNPFAAAPGGAEPRAGSATLGAGPAPKAKGKTKKSAKPAAAAAPTAKPRKPKKRPAAALEDVPDDASDAKLYKY